VTVPRHLPPGLRPERLARLARRAVESMTLDLTGATVLTEAATGAYVVTPVLAALAGAEAVDAVTRATRYGTVEEVTRQTYALGDLVGVSDRITIHTDGVTRQLVERADIVTNSGHLRPIDARVAGWMRAGAVVPLMFEAWEIDQGRDDVDLDALRARGIRYAGTNERYHTVDVFSYLGPMAVKLLTDAAVSAYASRVLLVCDNPFQPYVRDGLERAGASVVTRERFEASDLDAELDAIVLALTPGADPVVSEPDVAAIAERAPGAVMAQFWGDVPRSWCDRHGVPCVPADEPAPGHMGVLPSAVGPEPIVRLQAGGLKVGEVLLRDPSTWSDEDRSYVDEC
jgi:hypothetical protein